MTSYLGLQPQTTVTLVCDHELKESFPSPWHLMTSSLSLNWQSARRKTSALSLSKQRGAASCFTPSFLEEASIEKGSLDNQMESHSSGELCFSELLQMLHKATEDRRGRRPGGGNVKTLSHAAKLPLPSTLKSANRAVLCLPSGENRTAMSSTK